MAENDIAEEMTSDDSMLTIRTDETLRELDEHGTPGFPFVYYLDDLDRYAGRREEWHWHIEFEWCVAERGEVDCLIDSDRIRLREGDGIFIGSRVIHGFESAAPAIMPNVLFPPSFLFQEGTDAILFLKEKVNPDKKCEVGQVVYYISGDEVVAIECKNTKSI